MALSLFPLPATALAAALSFFCSLFLSPSVGSGFASHLRSDAVPPGSAAASLSFSSAVFSSAVHGSWPFFLFLRGLFSWREAVALPPGALPWFTECGLSSDRFDLGRGPPFVSAASIRRHSPSARKPVSLVGVLAHPPHSSGPLPFSLVSPLRPVGVSRSPFLGRSLGSCGPRGPPWIRAAGHPHRPRSRWLGGLVHPPQSPGLLPLSPLSS